MSDSTKISRAPSGAVVSAAARAGRVVGVVLAATAALSACVVVPARQRVVYAEPAYGQPIAVAEVAPPPPYVEVIPAVPFAGAVWLGGYWGWSGGRHQWVGGHYEAGRPGYGWRPHRWVQAGGAWHLHGGGWERR